MSIRKNNKIAKESVLS